MADFTNVEVTDTFDQWRIKTNNIGADVTALIGTVETDLDGFRTEIGTTISDFETELGNTLSSYVTLATDQDITGTKTFTNGCEIGQTIFGDFLANDNTTINTRIELGINQTSTKHQSYIDFHSDDSDTDFGARIARWNHGTFEISNKGTGPLYLGTHDGANIEMYGNYHASTGIRNNIYYDAENHYFRDKNGAHFGVAVNSTGISTNKLTITSGKMRLRDQDYTWPSSYAAGRYLKTDAQGNLSWEEVAGGTGNVNLSTLVFNDIVPVGTIIPWAATSLPADGKWKFCDGAEVSNTTYPQISALLGNRYGTAASGKTKLPNFAGRVPLGAGGAFSVGGIGGDTSSSINGSTGSVTLTAAQSGLPAHTHNTPVGMLTGNDTTTNTAGYDRGGYYTTIGNRARTTTSAEADATESHSHTLSGSVSTLQPYLTTQYIIKVLPDDVQQVSINAGNGIKVKNASNQDTTTLDLFSTKIELKADTNQFKFSSSGLLQLVTPVVSQASITTQINTAVSGLASTSHVQTAVSGLASTSYVQTAVIGADKTIRRAVVLSALSGTTTTAGFIIVKASSYTARGPGGRGEVTKAGYADITADGNTYPILASSGDEKAIVTIPIRAGATYSISGQTITATFIPLS